MPPNPTSSATTRGPAAPDSLFMVTEDHSEVPLKAMEDALRAPSNRPEAEGGHAQQIKWFNVSFFVVMHVAFLYSLAWAPLFKWPTWLWSIFTFVFECFGLAAGAHRHWGHRSFKAKLPLRVLMMLGHAMFGMNKLYDWVRDHRVHHRFMDTDADPHNARRGLFYSHVGWIMMTKHPEVLRAGKQVDVSDLLDDPVIIFDRKHHTKLYYLMCFVVPIVVPVLCWDETWICSVAACMMRWVYGVHMAFNVNSFAHYSGGQPFNKFISPADNKWVSLLGLGEGWHNYHHVFPWDYRTSETGYLNLTMHLIGMFERLGWAYDLKTVPPSLVRRVATRYGDGSHPEWATYAPEVPEAAARDPSAVDMMPPPPRSADGRRDKEA